MGYPWAITLAIFRANLWWWITLLITYFLGVGVFSDYPRARDQINAWLGWPLMPEAVPLWLILGPLMLWVIARLAHREAMTNIKSSRVVFGEPYITSFVSMYAQDGTGRILGENDIAKITVQNSPYDGTHGDCIRDSYASVSFIDPVTQRSVLDFDYARWQENEKPGYHTNPRDYIPDEWNRRDLRPSGERSTLNFLLKSRDEGVAYGFRAASQIRHPLWHERALELPAGEYLVKLTVGGVGLRSPAEQWLSVVIGGVGEPMRIQKTMKPGKRWFW